MTAGAKSQQVTVTATAINGFTSPVVVEISGLPAGVTAAPTSVTVTPSAPQTITLTANTTAATSSSIIVLTGTSGSLSHTTTFSLNVTAAPPPDFSLTLNPTSLTLTTGALGQQTTISATAANGFSNTISTSLSAPPTGVTAIPPNLTLTPGTPQTLTFTAAADATIGTYSIDIKGQSGSLSHTATLALTVAAPNGKDAITYPSALSRSDPGLLSKSDPPEL
jgi:hypothetical protein